MSQKNETTVLVLALLITAGLIAGGFWWFTQNGIKLNNSRLASNGDTDTPSPAGQPSPVSQFAAVQNVPTGLFNYGGSTSWAPIRLNVDSAIQAARPEFRLRYVTPTSSVAGSSTGIRMLIDGTLDFAQSSRSLQASEVNQAQSRGFQLTQIPVAIDGLAVAVNPRLDISGLTTEQLRNIYTGKITNWQQVGGPNLAIKPYSRPITDGGTVELFIQEILNNQQFAPNVGFVATTTQALRQISNNPGGIYYASAPEVVPQCTVKPLPLGRSSSELIAPYQEPFVPLSQCPNQRNQLNSQAFQSGQYPLTRNLFVVVKQNGQIEQQAGVAYANFLLSNRGQELISQSGFVRIR
ncbi:PstS family phosphate ABC transporter substrate-binding protein [Aliterella atlantica]|uniref:Phosphate ABC transporter substrate-binding protein n=1 Tax=Aliterella atlantica CENA595 TaxID=1618023 RepID=A0A0D8ZSI5_9CYAN|nr:PstS family phosphate ABC transporter substrate-binding protein [Aliterella atlantica]KJH71474.1 phosphate ABC transporter substrate-binding protein [Aliterella atlantica CENA595]